MKLHLLLAFFLLSSFSQVRADLVFQILETGGNVRIDYSGTLDMSGISFITVTPLEEHRIRLVTPSGGGVAPYTAFINLYGQPPTIRTYLNAFSSAPGVYTTQTSAASAFGGTGIHLPTGSLAQNATLRLYAADFTGDVWSGSGFLQWNNTTIAALGLDPSPKTWVLNNAAANKITMSVAAVPEPSGAMLLVSGLGLVIYRRRKKARAA